MKKQSLFLVGLLSSLLSYSQSITSEVISSGGGNEHLEWTIGEPIIVTFIGDKNILTEGFHQGTVEVTNSVNNFKNMELNVFPNPVTSILNVKVNTGSYWIAKVIDLNGKVLFENKNLTQELQIDFSRYPSSTFILVVSDDKNYATFNIIKR